ncbi:hypothetical protein V6N13_062234 [Hibiscus sabdariffa]|uniref:Uncharacterized protein n=1 Tax=Hibiscus sabdariffa TaxID=183260 RepID=A0ABR2BPV1_9ROSI
MEEDGSSSVFSTSNLHYRQQQSLIFPHQQLFQQNSGHLFHQHSHQLRKEPALNLQQNHGNQQHVSQNQHSQEDSPMKEPFWKSLHRTERSKHLDNKHWFFGELEAIYGENSPANLAFNEFQGHNAGANGVVDDVPSRVDHGPETSIGEQVSPRKIEKKKRKKKMKEQLCSMLVCFENLVKQVTVHQEELHKRLWEVIERMDKERSAKEESWRRQQATKREGEAIARANDQALASSRETLIVSYLEKITGQSINLDNNSRWPRAEDLRP